jgi:predicted RNA-binding Zn ribbon-like protein
VPGSSSPARAGQVPAPAEAVIELINSRRHSRLEDQLDDPEFAAELARRFAPAVDGVSPQVREALRGVREALQAIVLGPATDAELAAHWLDFTERTSDITLRHDLRTPGQVALRQVTGDPVLGGVVLAVAELVRSGAWSRLQICANEPCAQAFYDTTRSRTQRWHSYEICGNAVNVQAYRARHRQPSTPG